MKNTFEDLGLEKSDLEAVAGLAEEFVEKNQIIEIEKLYRRAKRELNINTKNLTLIIKHLFDEQYFIEGSKLIKQELLKNQFRSLIYTFIKKYPGVNFNTIKKYTFCAVKDSPPKELEEDDIGSSGQFIYHLEVLLKFICIKKIEFKKYSLFVKHGVDPQIGIYYFLLRDDINRKIFQYIAENHSIKQMEIPNLVGISKSNVSYRLKTLKEENIIISEKAGKSFEIKIKPENKVVLFKIFNDINDELIEMKKENKILPKQAEKIATNGQIKNIKDRKDENIDDLKLSIEQQDQVKSDKKYSIKEESPRKKDKKKHKKEKQKIT